MAENEAGSEKTEQPTAKKLSEAKEKGQVPKSQDLNAAIVLLASLLMLMVFGGDIQQRLVVFTQECMNQATNTQLSVEWFLAENPRWLQVLSWMVGPFMLVLAILTLFGTVMQTGLMWTLKPMLEPDFKKMINPIPGILKIFKKDNWFRLVMSVIKLAVIAAIAYLVIADNTTAIIGLSSLEIESIFPVSASLSVELGLKMAIAMLILALLDFQYQKYSMTTQLKMTKDEVKEETKSMEGDPKIRQRRRSIQMRLARERMMKNVAEADVVITNPVELAVALKYDQELSDSPIVVAKGARLMAQRIKEIAYSSEVPVVEHKPMARALYEAVEVGEMIPERLFKGVAEILAYVWEANKKREKSAS
jgi:flagellar biosynthetic protein FlhB